MSLSSVAVLPVSSEHQPVNSSAPLVASRRIPELDGLRGIAVLLVLLFHYGGALTRPSLAFVIHRGWSGVDLFFVLSGYLVVGILLDVRRSPNYFRTFYLRRMVRILPVYYFSLLAVSLSLILLTGKSNPFARLPSLYEWLLLQDVMGFRTSSLGLVGVAWSLALEEKFYFLAPLLVRRLSNRSLAIVFTTIAVMCPLQRFCFPQTDVAGFLRADGLSLGALLALWTRTPGIFTRIERLRFPLFLAAIAMGWLGFFHAPSGRLMTALLYTWVSLFYFVVLLIALMEQGTRRWTARVLRLKVLGYFGTISYALYLFHQPMHQLVDALLRRYYPSGPLLSALLPFALSVLAASLCWRFFEKPLLAWGARHRYETPAA